MTRRLTTALLALSSLCATGCAKKAAPASELNSNHTMYWAKHQAVAPAMYKSSALVGNMEQVSFTAASQRFIAEHDAIQVVTSESQLETAWQSVVTFCSTVHCEIVSSGITMRTPQSVPSGIVSMRVAPEDLRSSSATFRLSAKSRSTLPTAKMKPLLSLTPTQKSEISPPSEITCERC